MYKIFGYLLICAGLLLIFFSLIGMYKVFVNGNAAVHPSGNGSQKCHDCPKSPSSGRIIVFIHESGTRFFRPVPFVRSRWGVL